MSVTPPKRPTGQGKQVRGRQRAAHLATGALLVLYVYLPGPPDAVLQAGIRWVALPLLVITGVLFLTGNFTRLSFWFLKTFPALANFG